MRQWLIRAWRGGTLPMSEARFSVTYSGPALTSGEIEVNHLAPALLSIGDLCERVNRDLYGKESS